MSFCNLAAMVGSFIAACAFFGSVCISERIERICASPRICWISGSAIARA